MNGMYKIFAVCIFAGVFILLAPNIFAEDSCGGILSGYWFDAFNTCEERDAFSDFFGGVLPSDISLSWGGKTFENGNEYTLAKDESNPFVLTWDALPQPLGGCDEYGDACIDGLAVEIFYRDGDKFVAHWYGEFSESGVWTERLNGSMGSMYTNTSHSDVSFENDGEYYIFVHRPMKLSVNRNDGDGDDAFRYVLNNFVLPNVAFAYDGDFYGRSVVGGIRIKVSHGVEKKIKLTLPNESGYEGIRGVLSSGPFPEKGLASEDVFTFKVVYANSANVSPQSVSVSFAGRSLEMNVDSSAEDATLKDGDMTNGEQYVAKSTSTKGFYTYEFFASTTDEKVSLSENKDAKVLSFTSGYSSLAFLPGLQSSRLFKEGTVFKNQLWEPNTNADVEKLVMDENGKSKDKDIYTKVGEDGIVDEAFGLFGNIYKSFLDDLDKWKNDEHIISDYAVLPYDWRLAFDDVLSGGKVSDEKLYYDSKYATSTPYIFSELEKLASGSDSGRITIVAHSMGGLLLKKMLADLEDDTSSPYRDLLGKIDTVVFVAVPQFGTPKAVASMLHGYGQGLWPFATKETLRTVAHDMPGVYTLLPSEMYFEKITDVDESGTSTGYTTIIERNGVTDVTSYEYMRNYFNIDYGNDVDDLTVPMQPRNDFLDSVRILHKRLDSWNQPDVNNDGVYDFKVVQIAGWGMPETIKGIKYVKRKRRSECPDGMTGTCYEEYINPEPVLTYDGDSTVVLPSAVAMGGVSNDTDKLETLYVNMFDYNSKHKDRFHSSILEIGQLRSAIHSLLKKENVNEKYILKNKDGFNLSKKYLRIALHSPLDVLVKDDFGNETGLSETGAINDDISNSYYFEFGEGKYLGIPLNGNEYTVYFSGTDDGIFTLEFIEEKDGKKYITKTFENVPVSTSTTGEIVLSDLDGKDVLKMDTDGDGVADYTVYAKEYIEPVSFDLLKKQLEELDTKAKKVFLRKVMFAEFYAKNGKVRFSLKILNTISRQVGLLSKKHFPKKIRIPKKDAKKIKNTIKELKIILKNK